MKQTDEILTYMKQYGSITPLDALREFGIMRLASRINDLKAQGYNIERQIVYSTNRFGERVHFAEYRLRGDSNATSL